MAQLFRSCFLSSNISRYGNDCKFPFRETPDGGPPRPKLFLTFFIFHLAFHQNQRIFNRNTNFENEFSKTDTMISKPSSEGDFSK